VEEVVTPDLGCRDVQLGDKNPSKDGPGGADFTAVFADLVLNDPAMMEKLALTLQQHGYNIDDSSSSGMCWFLFYCLFPLILFSFHPLRFNYILIVS